VRVTRIYLERKHNLQKIKLAYEMLTIGIEVEDAMEEEGFKKLEEIYRKFCTMYAAGEIQ